MCAIKIKKIKILDDNPLLYSSASCPLLEREWTAWSIKSTKSLDIGGILVTITLNLE